MFIRRVILLISALVLFGCDARLNASYVVSSKNAVETADDQWHKVLNETRSASYSVFIDTDDPTKLEDPTFLNAMHGVDPNGSSFAVRPDGLVITNAHVIDGTNYCTGPGLRPSIPPPSQEDILREKGRQEEESARREGKKETTCLFVTQSFSKVYRARLIKMSKEHDIAAFCLLNTRGTVPFLEIESPRNIRDAIEVLTVGSPLGNVNMMTPGKISNLDFTAIDKETGKRAERKLQFSASILPGNSGGPLVSVASGKVVGQVVAAILINSVVPTGMSYANPVENITGVIEGAPSCSKN